ncbi:hypothetical protein C8R44DRAFT_742418 [Mycena epipterygia]|nr:hypothetical protein C8R44DRAFT_742418 [Mycena epipterygia]
MLRPSQGRWLYNTSHNIPSSYGRTTIVTSLIHDAGRANNDLALSGALCIHFIYWRRIYLRAKTKQSVAPINQGVKWAKSVIVGRAAFRRKYAGYDGEMQDMKKGVSMEKGALKLVSRTGRIKNGFTEDVPRILHNGRFDPEIQSDVYEGKIDFNQTVNLLKTDHRFSRGPNCESSFEVYTLNLIFLDSKYTIHIGQQLIVSSIIQHDTVKYDGMVGRAPFRREDQDMEKGVSMPKDAQSTQNGPSVLSGAQIMHYPSKSTYTLTGMVLDPKYTIHIPEFSKGKRHHELRSEKQGIN